MIPKLSGLNCPNCGAALEIRSFGNALNVVCPNCLSVLDAKDPNLQVLQQARAREKIVPLLPLGARGTLSGVTYEVIGFQVRTVPDEGDSYQWQEYLLFNPYHGFRYLVEYNGHWNFVRTLQPLPEPVAGSSVRSGGDVYKHFSSAQAHTSYVIGEFPWQIRIGDTVDVKDYLHTPRILSSETTADETVWSMGEYVTGADLWKAFALPGAAPAAIGVFENQPSPHTGETGGLWKLAFLMLLVAFMVALLLSGFAGNRQVYSQSVALSIASSVVTPPFDVGGHLSNLQVLTHNDLDQSVYVHYALIDQRTGHATEFGREVYRDDTATVPSVAAGRYYLRAEADHLPARFDIRLRRGVPSMAFFWITAILLMIPPAVQSWRKLSFERSRWAESSR